MSLQSLDIFSVRNTVVNECERFATSFTQIHADDIRGQIEAIYAGAHSRPRSRLRRRA